MSFLVKCFFDDSNEREEEDVYYIFIERDSMGSLKYMEETSPMVYFSFISQSFPM